MTTIAPIPTSFLDRVRTQGIDDLGQPVKRVIAEGGEPCRDVLRRAQPGEELILASFSPFTKVSPYHEYGPIFVLANDTGETPHRNGLPSIGDDGYLRAQFAIRAYSDGEEIVGAELTSSDRIHDTIDRLLALPDTAFLHVRFPAYGCFACRIDRL